MPGEFPVEYRGRRATVSWGPSAVRIFDRTTYALFKTFSDPTMVEVRLDGDHLVVSDGIESVDLYEDGVDLEAVAAGFDTGSMALTERPRLPISTTDAIAGATVVEVLGIVSGSATVGAAVFGSGPKGRGARSDDVAIDQDLSTARRMAFARMRDQAGLGSADAVVGVSVTHDAVGEVLVVTAVGTAVRLGRST